MDGSYVRRTHLYFWFLIRDKILCQNLKGPIQTVSIPLLGYDILFNIWCKCPVFSALSAPSDGESRVVTQFVQRVTRVLRVIGV